MQRSEFKISHSKSCRKCFFYKSESSNFTFFFLFPSHVGITDIERADGLDFSTNHNINFLPFKIRASDLLFPHRKLLSNAWQTLLACLPPGSRDWNYNKKNPFRNKTLLNIKNQN